MENKRFRTSGQPAFTLIEILIVVAIIAILASAILVSIDQSRQNARINGAKTSVRSILTAIVGCKDSGGAVIYPGPTPEPNTIAICEPTLNFSGALWPALPGGYTYVEPTFPTFVYDDSSCNFRVDTGNDKTASGHFYLECNCVTQICK